ncbi:MAG: ABC transporter permease [Desulfobacterales bacterium]|nr:ABC transporter permease [Desulfobacterales bacterium]MBF0397667.1 ABC transporter permease [Desulfobacterales bacterium]
MLNKIRFLAVSRKEFIHILRDWRSLALAIAIPVILILLFGYALTLDLKKVPTVVWDQSNTYESRELLSLFQGSPYFSITNFYNNYRDIQLSLDNGRAMIALVIPGDFAQKVKSIKPVKIQVIVDGSDANTSRLAMGYATAIGMIYSRNINAKQMKLQGIGKIVQPVELIQRAWYNPDLRSENVIIPGIIAIVLIVIAAMLTSITIAKEWEMGTMEQLISTPIQGPELIFGKIVPYFIIGMTDVGIAVAMGEWLFNIPIRGNPGLLFAISSVFLIGALFFGMTLSVVLKSQVIASQMAIVIGFMPTIILSGFVFAVENMPLPIQIITYIVPAKYFITIIRGIYMKGIGLEIMWLNALFLTIYAIIMVIASNKKLKLKLE